MRKIRMHLGCVRGNRGMACAYKPFNVPAGSVLFFFGFVLSFLFLLFCLSGVG